MNEQHGEYLWSGRFSDGPSDALLAFTESYSFDQRLVFDDIDGSRAHVKMLARVGLLTEAERGALMEALDQVEDEFRDDTFVVAPGDEDIHTAVERRVRELAGAVGGKLHTGRSRNDQSATDLRLYIRREGRVLIDAITALQATLAARAEAVGEVYLPGYTHFQRAQPVLLAHHLLAHFWALTRDVERFEDALSRADVSVLGAGALAGSSLPLDPAYSAGVLGFSRVFANSMDAVADRDHVAELLFAATLTQIHLSRIGEEVVLWSSEELGFLVLDDAYATGSSMMPNKKNPDIAELARGKAGRLIGDLTGFLATLKGLPLAYNRDLQEDKEPLFDAFDQLGRALVAVTGMLATCTFQTERMAAAADAGPAVATDLADYLVRCGMPFRDAHAVVAELVRRADDEQQSLESLVVVHPAFGEDARALLAPGASVRARQTLGSAGIEPVRAQLDVAQDWLAAR
ncbi:MAG: argininosuccinate lyase [Acidimicrobiia bacterium]